MKEVRHRLKNALIVLATRLDPSYCVVCGDDDRVCCVDPADHPSTWSRLCGGCGAPGNECACGTEVAA